MQDSAKYLIHADFTANGVVERSDVVGAVFGQTEGLLGDDLDLRELQEGSQVGRVEVDVESEGGQSFGEITIASRLDRVETAILAASLETIERVGPCRSSVTVTELEDVRSAKRREVVERATELLAEFEADAMSSSDIVEEVRKRVRVETVTDYEGYPAGPRVPDSDAVVVVEGRADVLQLLQYGIKNAVAVEGTDVPEAVADLTRGRTTTAFLDGDRGGELVLKELAQVGNIDYVAFAPSGESVEDLSRRQVMEALRDKVPFEAVEEGRVAALAGGEDAATPTDGGQTTVPESTDPTDAAPSAGAGPEAEVGEPGVRADAAGETEAADDVEAAGGTNAPGAVEAAGTATIGDGEAVERGTASEAADESGADAADDSDAAASDRGPATVAAHVREVVGGDGDGVRLLDADAAVLEAGPAGDAFDRLEDAESVPATVVVDGPVTQRLLDLAAQRGVERVVGAEEGKFVKRPTAVRVLTADDVLE
ncbi:DNA primase DnaG [Halomicrobium urmianum]|uniref:DNA primase DnaG n=1 Tax=Halomicrobium urmianum TaxID=1586233 RepID=UPI001CD981D2|nr:DNA primase DnaG [Halomicrobium urmianum]